jgi:hypothetical protein
MLTKDELTRLIASKLATVNVTFEDMPLSVQGGMLGRSMSPAAEKIADTIWPLIEADQTTIRWDASVKEQTPKPEPVTAKMVACNAEGVGSAAIKAANETNRLLAIIANRLGS